MSTSSPPSPAENKPQIFATRQVPVVFREDGCVDGFTCLSPVNFKLYAEIQVRPLHVIPVIMVPGIMGSNLCKKGRPDIKVWRPPNDSETAGAAFSGLVTNAKGRQINFIPEQAEVDPAGPVMLPKGVPWLDERVARDKRGWGTVHMNSYGELLGYLEYHLNYVFLSKQPNADWAAMSKRQDAAAWGAHNPKDFDPVTEDDLKKLPRAFYPVYAFGYNWLQSNEQAASALRQRIDEIIGQWKKPYSCAQVLLVTHSMGGLVGRRCAQMAPDKILGAFHGVMPALGAAAAYKRMRAGFEGGAAVVLGWNEAEATASIANAPGPLELLPQASYNGAKPWLHLQATSPGWGGALYSSHSLPLRDPYREIYEKDAKTCWYGLVNSDLIDPARLHVNKPGGAWGNYLENLKAANTFHKSLNDYYHPHTRAYYGADDEQRAWGTVCWTTHDSMQGGLSKLDQGTSPDSNGTGTIGVLFNKIKASFQLSKQDAKGDGTVPGDASGRAPALSPQVRQCYRMTGFDHQFSYRNPQVRLVMLHSLAKLAQRSPLLQKAPA
jgi:pimeloyl-ACP methyl ester carboxylesterase